MAEPSRRERDDAADARGPGVAARLAAAGSWMGQRDRGRGWEDHLAEFLAAMITWGGVGWLLDRWLGTAPWLMLAGVLLGNGLGIYLLYLHSSRSLHEDAAARERRRDPASGAGP